MKIDILTLFPNMFDGFISESIIKRAIEKGSVEINIHNFRDYADNPHKRVDDYPYGGGEGMVLMPQPIFDCIDAIKTDDSFIILLTPQGVQFNQKIATELTLKKHIIMVCGHYEGFDERIRSLADLELSIGDYVLTGGELPSMVISDSIIRLLDGVIKEDSHVKDSFQEGLLDYPVYTHPADFRGMKVPEVLLGGDHRRVDAWRKSEARRITSENRPDMLS
jgi:tRNA (guanine37-N1)-methyltransferase